MAMARGEDPKKHRLEQHLREAKIKAANQVLEEEEAKQEATHAREAKGAESAVSAESKEREEEDRRHSDPGQQRPHHSGSIGSGTLPGSPGKKGKGYQGLGSPPLDKVQRADKLKERKAREYAAMALQRGDDPALIQQQFEDLEVEREKVRKQEALARQEEEAKRLRGERKAERIAQEKEVIGIQDPNPVPDEAAVEAHRKEEGEAKAPASAKKVKLTKAERMALEKSALSDAVPRLVEKERDEGSNAKAAPAAATPSDTPTAGGKRPGRKKRPAS